jgi:hypothetical protein
VGVLSAAQGSFSGRPHFSENFVQPGPDGASFFGPLSGRWMGERAIQRLMNFVMLSL